MVKVLMVANFSRRGNGPAAYVGDLINNIKNLSNEFFIDVLVGAKGSYIKENEILVDNVFKVNPKFLSKKLLNIPKVRVLLWNYLKETLFQKILKTNHYDFVVIHSLPPDSDKLVKIAHHYGAKVFLFPWGSEVLRVQGSVVGRLNRAFGMADFIRADSETFVQKIMSMYSSIEKKQLVNLTYASPGLTHIDNIRSKYSRDELSSILSLPVGRYYIVCGYNAYKGQQHKKIIEGLSTVKNSLPPNYLLVFPLTYGQEDGVSDVEIKQWCEESGLLHHCVTNYMTDEQVACLHLITDLFIHIQVTDVSNSYLMESVYAGTSIVNGAWLRYPELEEDGLPYLLCESIEKLPETIITALDKGTSKINEENIKKIMYRYTWQSVAREWISFFIS